MFHKSMQGNNDIDYVCFESYVENQVIQGK